MTHFDPKHSHTFRRDYRTNVPSYYDYLAEKEIELAAQEEEIGALLDEELTKTVTGEGDLVEVTDTNQQDNRNDYTINVKHDSQKEQSLEVGNGLTISHGANGTDEKTSVSIDNTKVLFKDKVTTGKGLRSTQTVDGVNIWADTDTLQEKIVAGENILIENNRVTAIGDANVKSREPKFNHYLYSGRAIGTFTPIHKPAVNVAYSADELTRTGYYYLAQTNDKKTPANKRGFLQVTDIPTNDNCVQTFTNSDGTGQYVRVGSEDIETQTGKFWGEWQTIWGTEAVNKQGLYDRYVQHCRDYLTHETERENRAYKFITESTNTHKRSHMLSRLSNIHEEFRVFAIRPYSYLATAIYADDGTVKNRCVVYDTRTQTAVREGRLYPFGAVTDGIYIGQKLYVVNRQGTLFVYDETTDTATEYHVTPVDENSRKNLVGISYDRDTGKLYVNVQDGYVEDYLNSDRYIVYEADLGSNTYTPVLNVHRDGFKGGDIEVFKGKLYMNVQNLSDGAENGTGMIIYSYNLTTKALINKHTMTADMFPASLTLFNREIPVGYNATDQEGIDFMDGRIYRWDTYLAVGCYRPYREAFVTTIAPEYTDGVNDGIGTRLADWDKSEELIEANTSLLGNLVSTEFIDEDIQVDTYTKKQTDGIKELVFSKDSKYKLRMASRQAFEGETPEDWQIPYGKWNVVQGDSKSVAEFARHFNTPAMWTAGYIHYSEMDKDSSQREIAKGRNGLLIVDKDGEAHVTTREENNITEMFEATGTSGFHMGSMKYLVKDGVLNEGYLQNYQEDPNERTGRVMLTELNDGTRYVLVVTGHASQGTGWSHNDMIAYVQEKGLENIKYCFNFDGGGTTRLYTKDDNGKEEVIGSFVDNRTIRYMIYLDKENHRSNELYLEESALRAENKSEAVTYNQWKAAKDAGLSTVPGTQYEI